MRLGLIEGDDVERIHGSGVLYDVVGRILDPFEAIGDEADQEHFVTISAVVNRDIGIESTVETVTKFCAFDFRHVESITGNSLNGRGRSTMECVYLRRTESFGLMCGEEVRSVLLVQCWV